MYYFQLTWYYYTHIYYIHNKLTLDCSRDCNWFSALSKSNMLKKWKSEYLWNYIVNIYDIHPQHILFFHYVHILIQGRIKESKKIKNC